MFKKICLYLILISFFLSSCAKEKNEISCELLIPNCELVKIFADKYLGSKWLSKNKLGCPKTTLLSSASEYDLPLIVKPRFGSGSQGIYVVKTKALLDGLKVEHGDKYIAQEYLFDSNQEYTCALFKDKNISRD